MKEKSGFCNGNMTNGARKPGLVLVHPTTRFTNKQLSRIEDNLLVCLTSDCPGMQATAALTILQLKNAAPEYFFSRSIIPLTRIVKNEDCADCPRIAAGLALHALESARGDYAIKMTAYFTEVENVKKMYDRFVLARAMERLALQ